MTSEKLDRTEAEFMAIGVDDDEKNAAFALCYTEELFAALRESMARERWIPVSERLPEPGTEVLMWERYDNKPYVGHRGLKDGKWNRTVYDFNVVGNAYITTAPDTTVTHWKPITPPEGE